MDNLASLLRHDRAARTADMQSEVIQEVENN